MVQIIYTCTCVYIKKKERKLNLEMGDYNQEDQVQNLFF